jgi:hypothetical protein
MANYFKELYMKKEMSPYKKISIGNRLVLWFGVLRRLFLFLFNKKYVEKNISLRKGKCINCGTCCKLFIPHCIHLIFDSDGKSLCKKYKSFRMPNCKIFPIDYNDIKDRNIVSDEPCGYYFE